MKTGYLSFTLEPSFHSCVQVHYGVQTLELETGAGLPSVQHIFLDRDQHALFALTQLVCPAAACVAQTIMAGGLFRVMPALDASLFAAGTCCSMITAPLPQKFPSRCLAAKSFVKMFRAGCAKA